ncbi:uncharacterized protein LOC100822203 [Brachypodium distachyon]|uniref:Uncharacterized protein n=1 Tax=Brachypodium distachyon TaxID=15368 RepID=I1GTY8_BRADI|nr:uncharacterized protein LOC100822203 [Brachypodium distachyon]KQK15993.1 hypothetical protein BRADI_1g26220v3 [Brachypodium distachyon]|eukprot:XP_010237709.1 uncharacterized protein LOC100822203 [Brachypodium distachyon]
MLLLRAAPTAYAKVDKVDAEEARHWKAQFLIHKLLDDGRRPPATRRPAAAFARGGACRARIGVRLKRLRLAVRSFRLRVCRSVHKHLRNIARLGSPRS